MLLMQISPSSCRDSLSARTLPHALPQLASARQAGGARVKEGSPAGLGATVPYSGQEIGGGREAVLSQESRPIGPTITGYFLVTLASHCHLGALHRGPKQGLPHFLLSFYETGSHSPGSPGIM